MPMRVYCHLNTVAKNNVNKVQCPFSDQIEIYNWAEYLTKSLVNWIGIIVHLAMLSPIFPLELY